MKVPFLSIAFLLASLCLFTVADVDLNPFPTLVDHGASYTLSWSATANYTYTIWLVTETSAENEYQWKQVSSLGTGIHFSSLSPGFVWTVPSNLSTQGAYAIWLDALPNPFNGESYSDITEWFMISSSNSSATTSVAPSATASTSQTSNPTHTGASSISSHHNNLSGGAIAGIVIGSIAAVALIIAAVILFLYTRKRAAKKKREASARANRLAPVMEESSHAYEMHGRTPAVAK